MSKVTDTFKKTIQQYLDKRAEQDSLFAETLKKENKNIDECVNYILGEVQKSGYNGFADEEIYNMAVHYYDEDDLKAVKRVSANVIVNHKVELTDEDKAAAKEKAMQLAIEKLVVEQKEKLVQKATKKQLKEVSKETKEVDQIDLFA